MPPPNQDDFHFILESIDLDYSDGFKSKFEVAQARWETKAIKEAKGANAELSPKILDGIVNVWKKNILRFLNLEIAYKFQCSSARDLAQKLKAKGMVRQHSDDDACVANMKTRIRNTYIYPSDDSNGTPFFHALWDMIEEYGIDYLHNNENGPQSSRYHARIKASHICEPGRVRSGRIEKMKHESRAASTAMAVATRASSSTEQSDLSTITSAQLCLELEARGHSSANTVNSLAGSLFLRLLEHSVTRKALQELLDDMTELCGLRKCRRMSRKGCLG